MRNSQIRGEERGENGEPGGKETNFGLKGVKFVYLVVDYDEK